MKILITDKNQFTGDDLKVGKYYQVQEFDEGTEKQNRLFHKLLQIYWASKYHNTDAKNYYHFRELIKLSLGAGVEKYYSILDENGKKILPKVQYRIKSWANYSKKERTETIKNLISEMQQCFFNTGYYLKEFEEIIKEN